MFVRALATTLGAVTLLSAAPASAQTVSQVFKRVRGSVAIIYTAGRTLADRSSGELVSIGGLGSGVLISDDEVLTAAHVVQTADQVMVEFPTGERVLAQVVTSEPAADLALLRLDSRPQGVVPAPLGDSDLSEVGDEVFVVGASFACGVLRGGAAVCWGSNVERQLGTDVTEMCSVESFPDVPCARSPVKVDFAEPFVMTTAGSAHACGVTESGGAVCWGNNTFGQLGNGLLFADQVVPGRVAGRIEFNSVSAGASHTCGAATDGALFCWGINDHFQLGNDTTRIGEIPVLVSGEW